MIRNVSDRHICCAQLTSDIGNMCVGRTALTDLIELVISDNRCLPQNSDDLETRWCEAANTVTKL
ncbi:hypothetical protein KSB_76770 [Ktedonobacter robiniae]|uniref:Uncharacterized protein n=1 Tax=Ktedonobacter robiniae TaxID=2778365 RepID=A0ABQ3V3R3_9CHLR|nr:hypothetical protein KSB_76770 [Ktedonobacter robiniae]